MIYYSDLLNAPYKAFGRSKEEGFDCYGLVIELSKRMGKPLPDIWYDSDEIDLFTQNMAIAKLERIEAPEEGALIEMDYNNTLHMGICLDNKSYIHTTRSGVKVNRIGSIPVIGFYKWD